MTEFFAKSFLAIFSGGFLKLAATEDDLRNRHSNKKS
jgi:hypothetical protein